MVTKARRRLGEWLHGWERPLPEVPALVHFNEAQARPGHRLPAHTHDQFELCYLVAGRARWSNPDGVFDVGPGDLYLTLPGELHEGVADLRDPHHNFAIGFDLTLRTRALGNPAASAEEIHAVDALTPRRRVIPRGRATGVVFAAIRRELETMPAPGDPQRTLGIAMIQALLTELAVLATRLAIAARNEPADADLAIRHAAGLRAAEARLHGRLDAPPTLAEMAAWADLSPGHFAVLFKHTYHRTPLEHLTQLRVMAAAQRLRADARASVTEVALEFGFCSSQYFSEVFKRVLGSTPSDWRNNA